MIALLLLGAALAPLASVAQHPAQPAVYADGDQPKVGTGG